MGNEIVSAYENPEIIRAYSPMIAWCHHREFYIPGFQAITSEQNSAGKGTKNAFTCTSSRYRVVPVLIRCERSTSPQCDGYLYQVLRLLDDLIPNNIH